MPTVARRQRSRSFSASWRMSVPAQWTEPRCGRVSPVRTSSSDVLPAPEGPVIPTDSPAAIVKSSTSRTGTELPSGDGYESSSARARSSMPTRLPGTHDGGAQAHLTDEAGPRIERRAELEGALHVHPLGRRAEV